MLNHPAAEIERELSSGERLAWSGQPRHGIRLRATDVLVIPFSLFWCGFAVFWEVMAFSATTRNGGPAGVVFPLFGVPFVIMGLYFVFGRFFVDARARAHTFYGVTNERIIIVSGLLGRRVKSLNLRTLCEISLAEKSDGGGTITFGAAHSYGQWFPAGSWPGAARYAPPAFDMIDGAKEVYDIIRQMQKSAA